ncbi:MAG: Gfo/Idh/MocA family oxidoreductase [Elusimicrobia bacterium]|nr:Gfo/Idh/MocA family oxidoreductase [Elusimicrobiota bacterium]
MVEAVGLLVELRRQPARLRRLRRDAPGHPARQARRQRGEGRRRDAQALGADEGLLAADRRGARPRTDARRRPRRPEDRRGASEAGLPRGLRGGPQARGPHDGLQSVPAHQPAARDLRGGGARRPVPAGRGPRGGPPEARPLKRAGLVGFGAIAENAHLPALAGAGVSLAAVADNTASRRNAAARAVPSARLYSTVEELLRSETALDFIVVATPPLHHADSVLAALRAGLPVLCEKPLTLDPEAFAAIRAESEARGLAVYSVNNWAFSPQWSRLLETAASGRLGPIRHAEIRVLRTRPSVSALPGDWRKDPAVSGGGILVDHGWHNLYLMRRLLGAELELAETVLRPSGAVDEVATVLLKAPGASGTIHLSWRAGERSNAAFVAGERGTAELRDDRLIVKADGAEETVVFPEKLSAGSAHPEWLAAMWPAFEAELAGRGRGQNLAEAAFCLETIRRAYGAAEASRA